MVAQRSACLLLSDCYRLRPGAQHGLSNYIFYCLPAGQPLPIQRLLCTLCCPLPPPCSTIFPSLNDVEDGGSTRFDALNLAVQPQRGTALLFFPSFADGTPDARWVGWVAGQGGRAASSHY